MSYYRIKDFPTYIEDSFYCLICDIDIQRDIIQEIINTIIIQNKESLVIIGILVGILKRQLECSTASMFLASRKFFRDAATLILTLMELRLDLEYIAKNQDNELKWLKQDKLNRKIWSVTKQIKEVAKDKDEESSDLTVYEFLSIIKHGNPALGHISFNISAKEDMIILDTKNSSINPNLLLGTISYQFERSIEAVINISERKRIDLSIFKQRIIDINAKIKTQNFDTVNKMIIDFLSFSHREADRF